MLKKSTFKSSLFIALSCVILAGCNKNTAGLPPTPAPEVVVHTVAESTTSIPLEIVSDIRALNEVEIRARASGLVTKQFFKPGQNVKAEQVLMQIDTRVYDEAIVDAQAKLADAQAQLARFSQDVARYQPLLKDNAIPRQTYENALAQEKSNQAVVQARVSALERARIDRSYTEVRSPISGRIGLQKIEVGALATAGQTIVATVSAIDQMVAYFSLPEKDYISLARRNLENKNAKHQTTDYVVELILADGSKYEQPGKIDFADRALDVSTGTLPLRAVFPNPDGLLRPGMGARVRIMSAHPTSKILVPQKAISEVLGNQFATVVTQSNEVEKRPVTMGARVGDLWVVEQGLKAGEVIVLEGLQKARPGTTVKPITTQPSAAK